jgi:hypothetical protein
MHMQTRSHMWFSTHSRWIKQINFTESCLLTQLWRYTYFASFRFFILPFLLFFQPMCPHSLSKFCTFSICGFKRTHIQNVCYLQETNMQKNNNDKVYGAGCIINLSFDTDLQVRQLVVTDNTRNIVCMHIPLANSRNLLMWCQGKIPKLWFCFDLFIMLAVANNHCGWGEFKPHQLSSFGVIGFLDSCQ